MRIAIIGTERKALEFVRLNVQYDINVVLYSPMEEALSSVQQELENYFTKQVAVGEITTERREQLLSHITLSFNLNGLKGCSLIFELDERERVDKHILFKELDELFGNDTILVSNTSCGSITELASLLDYPERIIGVQLYNPLNLDEPSEIICGKETAENTLIRVRELFTRIGMLDFVLKEATDDSFNRLLFPLINQSATIWAKNKPAIDTLSFQVQYDGLTLSPLQWADYIGVDICLYMLRYLFDAYDDECYYPCHLLVEMVEARLLGRKTQQGFYVYA